MKIHSQKILKDGSVEVKLCLCKGETHCKPEDRPNRVFKSMQTLKRWTDAFKIRLLSKK